MTVLKSEQRDDIGRDLWSRLKGRLFKTSCPAYISVPGERMHYCLRRLGHPECHSDDQISWGYSDNWFKP